MPQDLSKEELMAQAKHLKVEGRSKMNKDQLFLAVRDRQRALGVKDHVVGTEDGYGQMAEALVQQVVAEGAEQRAAENEQQEMEITSSEVLQEAAQDTRGA